MNKAHHSPYDRGRADAYYGGRGRENPHYYEDKKRIFADQMTKEQRKEYYLGYSEQLLTGEIKDYGE